MNNKEYYVNNWSKYWKTYIELNPDLTNNGISSKRSSLNHFVKHGYDENRQITTELMNIIQHKLTDNENKDSEFLLHENMFKEKYI